MAVVNLLIDAWSNLSHKRGLDGEAATSPLAPTWIGRVGGPTWRRLAAYKTLRLYLENSARHVLANESESVRRNHREYGDPFVLSEAIRSAVIGDNIEIVVDNAGDDPEAEGLEPGQADEIRRAEARQTELREWAAPQRERFPMRVIEGERHAVGVGDVVYLISWSGKRGRPKLRVYDPGFYFPVLDPSGDDEYPERVHIAWQWEDDNGDEWVRRITWEIGPLGNDRTNPGTPFAPYVGAPRALPWRGDDGESLTATTTCYMSDATWKAGDVLSGESNGVDAFTLGTVNRWATNDEGAEVRRLDLGFDFLPLVHLPNTIAGAEHFGRASISNVLQIFDDIAAADTDLSKAAAVAGTPPIAVDDSASPSYVDQPNDQPHEGTEAPQFSGRRRKALTYGPGQVMRGKVTVVDTSNALNPLIEFIGHLLERLSTNGRTPEEILGRVGAADVPSGVTLALAFGPFRAMIDEMRLVREQKYGLLLKFVQRLMILGQITDDPRVYPATVAFGSFLPSDLSGVVEIVVKLLAENGISRRTALMMLVDAGLDIDGTIDEEVQRIRAEDFEGAGALADAAEDVNAARDYLGLDPIEDPGAEAAPGAEGDEEEPPEEEPPRPPGVPPAPARA